jgi:glycosyltransferase involved in cell wall biosynthesis
LKILYFYQYFSTPKGSWGTRVYEFASEWVKQGHEVTVITSVYEKSDIKASKFIEDQYFEGIKVKIINVSIDNKQPVLKRIFTFSQYAVTSSWFALTLEADIVVASSGPITVGIPGLVARYIRKRKLVFETRDLWPEGAIELGIIKNAFIQKFSFWLQHKCYHASSLIVALSPGMRNHILTQYPGLNVIEVTNAANIELFSSPRPFNGNNQIIAKKYAIYTGNIGEVNNSRWLLDAAIELKKRNREDIKILLVGEGQHRMELEERAFKCDVSNFIRWGLMPKEDLVGLIQQAMVSLVPLKGLKLLDTSSPNKFFESLAAGIPVVQTTNGWMKEFLDLYEVGFTLNPDDPVALAEKLIELDANPELLYIMGNRAFKIASKEFDKTYLAKKMIHAMEAVNKKTVDESLQIS